MIEEEAFYGEMNEDRARAILRRYVGARDTLRDDRQGIAWPGRAPGLVDLKGMFTADELEAVAWWMRNKPVQ